MRIRRFAAATAATTMALTGLTSLTAGLTTEASAAGTSLRIASFNVRSARINDGHAWTNRAGDVAREIVSRHPGVVALQELSPGRADGQKGTVNGTPRQTESLLSALRSAGGGNYALVRTTPYVVAGTPHGSQGTRILYDTSRYSLVSDCPETTGKRRYSTSCSMDLPILGSDSASDRRSAAFAELKDKRSGKHFVVASVHLDHRHSGNASTERRYDQLRRTQMAAVYARATSMAGGHEVIVAGDYNAWTTKKPVGNLPGKYLSARGFKDTSKAAKRVNTKYSTMNHFKTVQSVNRVALDWIMAKGISSSKRYEVVTKRVDSDRPSDHNMIVSDIVL